MISCHEDFQREVSREKGIVLVACIAPSPKHGSQLKALEDSAEVFGRKLKFCLIDDPYGETFAQEHHAAEIPTFILFSKGIENGRRLGRLEEKDLNRFLIDSLSGMLDPLKLRG